jgi:hypothetical protein
MSTRIALTVGLFVEAVQRGDGEELLERPVVEQGLEDGEIADVLVGEERGELVQFLRAGSRISGPPWRFVRRSARRATRRRRGFQVEVAEVEEGEGLLLFLDRVVETLEPAELGLVLQHDLQIGDDLVLDLGLVLVAEGFALVDALEDLDDEQGVRGDDGAAGLADNVRHVDVGGRADLADVEDHVAGVFLHRVVHRGLEVRARAVVVDAEAAADVEVAHGEAHLRELAVEPRRLDDGVLDRDDVRHLRTDMEVDELAARRRAWRP